MQNGHGRDVQDRHDAAPCVFDSAKVYTCKPTGAGTYHVRTENSVGAYEGELTVQNGLITRVEEDVAIGVAGSKMHTSTKYDYANVKAPCGV